MRVPIHPQPHQHVIPGFLVTVILVGVKLYLTMVLLCISIITNNAESFFMCLLGIHTSPLVKCLFKPFAHLKYIFFNFMVLFTFTVVKNTKH